MLADTTMILFRAKLNRNKNRAITSSSLVLALVFFCWFLAPISVAKADNSVPLVALFGDSITYGYARRGRGDGRPDIGAPDRKLSALLNDSRRPSVVVNLGWGGTPTGPAGSPGLVAIGNGLERINRDLDSVSAAYPDSSIKYIVILYGFNDRAWGIPNATTAFNVEQMILRAINRGYVPIVGSIAPCLCSNSTIASRNRLIESRVVSLRNRGNVVHYVDQYSLLLSDIGSLLIPDGVHPNDQGYQRIANNWFNLVLKNLIEKKQVIIPAIPLLLLD